MTTEIRSTRLRPVATEDLERILEIEQACFSAPWPRSAFELAVRTPRILFRTVAVEEVLGGYVVAVRDEEGVLVANLAVHPSLRRRRVGTDLLDAAIDWAQVLRAPICHLEVRISNTAAIEMYRSRGFRTVGIQRRYYRHPLEDAFSMELRLRGWERSAPAR